MPPAPHPGTASRGLGAGIQTKTPNAALQQGFCRSPCRSSPTRTACALCPRQTSHVHTARSASAAGPRCICVAGSELLHIFFCSVILLLFFLSDSKTAGRWGELLGDGPRPLSIIRCWWFVRTHPPSRPGRSEDACLLKSVDCRGFHFLFLDRVPGQGCIGRGRGTPPLPGRPAYAQPLSP